MKQTGERITKLVNSKILQRLVLSISILFTSGCLLYFGSKYHAQGKLYFEQNMFSMFTFFQLTTFIIIGFVLYEVRQNRKLIAETKKMSEDLIEICSFLDKRVYCNELVTKDILKEVKLILQKVGYYGD